MTGNMKNPGRGDDRDTSKALAKIDPNTHAGKVLAALHEQPMSNIEVMWELNIAHPPAAVRDLRRAGIGIVTQEHPHPTKPGEKIKRYHLINEG
ncbi:helix-turn-helix domain-containing protein [Halomonas saccharevitans]|uniref:Helix-turn-helix domain-containing protein n=1 Tax=Halomonas saccharevitans TaxID=416872 RepID=A0ABU3NI13_9GAMM|nr:helix-turn-helix domain-containing protein [Halomonas saccharevitans]MDT8880819.1 helix-turn-helix domain-containing protein [Halomonas saccharevitans]